MSNGATPGEGPTVLFVSPDATSASRSALETLGGTVHCADRTDKGLRLLNENPPDLAVLDMGLPSGEWLGLASLLKDIDPDLPIILTARAPRRQDLMDGLRAGADLFLERPLEAESLRREALPLMARADQLRSNRLRQSTAAAILDASPAPMVITDGTRIDYLNRPMMQIAGVKPRTQPSLCRDLERLVPMVRLHAVDDQSDFLRWIRIALDDPEHEHLVKLSDSPTDKTYLMRVTPLEGLGPKYSISLSDVTSIENERRMFHRLATTDPLTGVYNRRKFMEDLDAELVRAGRYGSGLSLIMADIDDFKSINDTQGHQAGDVALVELACLLRDNIRSMDLLARYGGEEFAIIIPQTELDGAQCMAGKLCSKIARTPFAIAPDMTCSMGVASFHEGDSVHALIERADQGLYKAKDSGKNRAVCVPRTSHEPKGSKAI